MSTNDRLRDVRILIVDDDKDTREMLRFVLQQADGEVVTAGSVAEAFDSYKSSPPDVIVADIGMPEYNGYALISLIRAHDKELGRTTPVIALTARAMVGVHEQSLSAGCDDYDAERIDLDRLLGKVEAQPARAASS